MFWSDWKNGLIKTADMDGQGRAILVSRLGWPNALVPDPVERKLYWIDALTNSMENINYDGTNRRVSLSICLSTCLPFCLSS